MGHNGLRRVRTIHHSVAPNSAQPTGLPRLGSVRIQLVAASRPIVTGAIPTVKALRPR